MSDTKELRTVNWWYQHNITPNPPFVPIHTHSFYELYCFVSGDVVYHIEGNSYHLQPYDILVINNNESHTVEFLSDAPYDRICLHFRQDFIEQIDNSGYMLAPFEKRNLGVSNLFRPDDMDRNICEFLVKRLAESAPNREVHITTTLLMLLNELARNFVNSSEINTSEPSRLSGIIQYINSNICQNISLDDICNNFYISKPQLLRIFKKAFGTTVHNYITVKRLAMARQMLSLGNAPSLIYQNCGFSDYSVFYKAFKKHFGQPPSQHISPWESCDWHK